MVTPTLPRRWGRTLGGLALVAAELMAPVSAWATCRQALVLGLDVSGSVDAREYRLQLDGLARALTQPKVRAAFLAQPDIPIRLAVFEWSGPEGQRVLIAPTDITDDASLNAVAAALQGTTRGAADPTTALGSALQFGAALAEQGCWRQVLDISGDGASNTGPRPQDLPPLPPALVVNGLVIGSEDPTEEARPGQPPRSLGTLRGYYQAHVIRGPGAFVETADNYDGYADAMARKLLREVQSLAIGGLGTPDSRG